MKIFLLGFLAFLTLSAIQAQDRVIYDPHAVKRDVTPFKSIEVSGGIDLYLSPSEEEALAVSAGDDQTRDGIITEVVGGVLKIRSEKTAWKITRGMKKRVAYVSCKELEGITASGSSDVTVYGALKGDMVTIRLTGASGFKGTINVNKLRFEQSGASDATVNGQTVQLDIVLAGASKLRAYDLQAEKCRAEASGASDVRVTVKKEISATASGASSIYYRGEAAMVDTKTSGASSVGKRG